MSEDEVKKLLKMAVEHGNRPFTVEQKEALKCAIDNCKTSSELLIVVLTAIISN
mgnify:CR=1 FL=1